MRWLKSKTIAAHMVMWVMSDRGKYSFLLHYCCSLLNGCLGIPRSFRMMQGFGVNTFTLVNAKGERHFVKFHWIPELGVHSLMWDESLKISGQDPGTLPYYCSHFA
jgi:catalase